MARGSLVRRIGRRDLLRGGAAGAAALAAWAGGGVGVSAAARPVRQATVITLNWAVNYQGIAWSPAQNQLTQQLLEKYWLPQHPGVRVNTFAGSGSNGPSQGSSAAIAEILAGVGPDILSGCCTDLPTYLGAGGILAPLDPWLKRDNIDAHALFSPGHLAALTTPEGLMALPAYDGPQVLLVNLGALDRLGLKYPDPGWTVDEAVRLWEAASGHDPKAPNGWRYGVVLNWYVGGWGGYWLPFGWGGNWIDPTLTKPLFDSPATVQSIEWIMDLFTRKVALARGAPNSMGGWGSVHGGLAVMGVAGGWDTLSIATNMQSFKWDYFPMPIFPSGQRTTMINVDFVGMNAQTKYPELTWSLFKFAAISKTYQEFNMRTTLVNPSRVDMWDVWEQLVQTVAPPLRGKSLHWYHDAVQYGHGHIYFRYLPIQANNLIGQATQEMGPPAKQDVATILSQLNRQIAALEAEGPALEAAAAKELAVYHAYVQKAATSSQAITYPAPPVQGSGVPPKRMPSLLVVGPAGTYTLKGAGSGVTGASDNCAFAGQPFRLSRGEFVCRVVAISAPNATSIANGAKVGLMARDNLSDNAASVGLEVALGRGVHFHVRAVDGDNLGDNRPNAPTQPTGLIGAQVILADDSKPAKNYLLKPVWLKLVLDVASWTPFTSLDGVNWTQAAPPAGVEFVGAWVGLFVTSHQSGHYIQAVFDHVTGFAPEQVFQIGSA
jgi:hypothetical protein